MTTEFLSREQAAEHFLNMLIARAYDGALRDVRLILEEGPPGRKPPKDLIALHQWFRQLDDESREYVLIAIREAVDAAVFGCLVLLDGLTGGYPVGEELSDFALYLQTYEDSDSRAADLARHRVRLNPWTAAVDLHDMFRWILQERAGQGE